MSWKSRVSAVAMIGLAFFAFAGGAQAGEFEVFAGYYLPEELDEDLTFGLRFGDRVSPSWGWQVGGSWFDVADSQGYGTRDIDADLFFIDGSFMFFPGEGQFAVYAGPGWASAEIDSPFSTEDFSDDVFSLNVGISYKALLGESMYLRPDLKARWYELEGFGPEGGKQSQVDYEASLALGWTFGG
jgi:hypothetical protein